MSKKILIIRFSSIGDIVLTTPVIRALHQQLNAEIHFLTKPPFASILLANPYVSKVITPSEDFEKLILLLKNEHYDHIIDLHHNLRTARLKLALNRPSSSFHKLNFEKWLIVNFKINRLPEKHIVDRYLDSVSRLGVINDNLGLDFFIPPDKEVNIQQHFGFQKHSYAALVVGAAHETKCMTIDQIIKLIELLNLPVILLGGKQETEKAQAIINKSNESIVKSACGDFDIFQSASILEQAATIISHDTGLMHIAAALKKPQVVVWGNTIPEFGMYPYYGNHAVEWISFEQKGLYCRPCTKLGFKKCPQGHFKCMLDHDLHKIATTALNLLTTARLTH
ncbi:MAG TPA: glycosyltransferase family 9 protein [Saprospiraceae bacterium]|nr:glycosyltransferase family 9 protein [Saprospiraceae bacterium]